MISRSIRLTILAFLFLTNTQAQNSVCFDIEANPNPNDPAFGMFSKYVNVLDCIHVYAVASISDEKVLHAAAVAAELLDNDEDGIVDDSLIENALMEDYTVMPIFHSEYSSAIDDFFDNFEGCAGAILFRDEIDPSAPGYWGSDASVEEILHTINSCGHVEVYPAAFSLEPNSSLLTEAMDVARGGQFLTVPDEYPEEAWYHYDDWTCDYECMAMEYLYWCIVTNMGILADEQTCQGIADEWEPCTPELFEATDTLMYNIVTDPAYKLPQLAPDGNYCPGLSAIEGESSPSSLSLSSAYPNPFNPTTTIRFDIPVGVETHGESSLEVFDLKGRLVKTLADEINHPGQYTVSWDATNSSGVEVSAGIYIVKLNVGNLFKSNKIVLLK